MTLPLTWLWMVTGRAIERRTRFRPLRRVELLLQLGRLGPRLLPFVPSRATGALGRDMAVRPDILGAAAWPYVCAAWTPSERLAAIAEHYRLVDRSAPMLAFPLDQSLELLDLRALHPELRVVLDKPHWFRREGQVVINLFLAEERLFSLAFALGQRDGVTVAHVGAVQGVRGDGVTDAYRDLTKALHGMRPRDFLIDVFREFCGLLGIRHVLAVRDALRVHRHAYFGEIKAADLFVDYDAVWLERGATAGATPQFMELAPTFQRRDPEEIAAKKRALYRRRYEMLEALSAQMRRVCDEQQRLARGREPASAARGAPSAALGPGLAERHGLPGQT